jgi:hypothetical protein
VAEGVQQVPRPRRRDRQRPGRRRALQAEIEFQLASRDPLPGGSLQRLKLGVVVRGADVLDLPRPAPRRPHDLDRRRTRLRLHRPPVRHPLSLRSQAPPCEPDGKLRGPAGNSGPRILVTWTGTCPPGKRARPVETIASPGLVRIFTVWRPGNYRSARCVSRKPVNVSQVRLLWVELECYELAARQELGEGICRKA